MVARTIRDAMNAQRCVRRSPSRRSSWRAVKLTLSRRPEFHAVPPRSLNWILDSYANPGSKTIVRVAQEPRRKLAADDRLTGPGIACLAAGFRPLALADRWRRR